ncbi:hypothetical protein MTO96_018393 [Rhipicephalus appendiculatus]
MGDELPPDFPQAYSLSSKNRSRAYDLLLKEASNLLRLDEATTTSGAPTERRTRTRTIKKSPGKARKRPRPGETKKGNPRRTPASRVRSPCAGTPPLQTSAVGGSFFPLPFPPVGHLFPQRRL